MINIKIKARRQKENMLDYLNSILYLYSFWYLKRVIIRIEVVYVRQVSKKITISRFY